MKKGLLITLDFWPRTGGVASHYQGLVENVHEVQISVLTPEIKEKPKSSAPHASLYQRPFFFHFFWPKWIKIIFEIIKLEEKNNFDFFIVGDILPVGTAVWFTSFFLKKPYFVFIHGTDITLATRSLFKTYLSKKILSRATGVFANSKITKSKILALDRDEEKIHILYPALPQNVILRILTKSGDEESIPPFVKGGSKPIFKRSLRSLDPSAATRPQDDNIVFTFLSIARLVERKGIQFVLSALGKLKREKILKNFQYIIIGNGPEKERIFEKIKEENLENEVVLLDQAGDEEKFEWFSRADVFILTPYEVNRDYEGFGIVYLEAQAFGVPIIASKTGGVPEAVPDGEVGILVENPKDFSQIADAIKKLLADKERMKKFSTYGRLRTKEFTWEKRAKEFEEIVKKWV